MKTNMRDFLLDTNIWAYWFDPKKYSEQHANIQERLKNLPSYARLSISVISWGEIAVGLPDSIQTRHLEFIRSEKPSTITLDHHIAEEYGKLRGNISIKRKKGLNRKDSVDRFTWLEIGSLENDLWIAAQAITLNLTLVTNDNNKGMKRIREVAGKSLHVANWAVNDK